MVLTDKQQPLMISSPSKIIRCTRKLSSLCKSEQKVERDRLDFQNISIYKVTKVVISRMLKVFFNGNIKKGQYKKIKHIFLNSNKEYLDMKI